MRDNKGLESIGYSHIKNEMIIPPKLVNNPNIHKLSKSLKAKSFRNSMK